MLFAKRCTMYLLNTGCLIWIGDILKRAKYYGFVFAIGFFSHNFYGGKMYILIFGNKKVSILQRSPIFEIWIFAENLKNGPNHSPIFKKKLFFSKYQNVHILHHKNACHKKLSYIQQLFQMSPINIGHPVCIFVAISVCNLFCCKRKVHQLFVKYNKFSMQPKLILMLPNKGSFQFFFQL